MASGFENLAHSLSDGCNSRYYCVHQSVIVGNRNVGYSQSLNRCIKIEERFLRNGCRNLGTESRSDPVLVHNQTASRSANRLEHAFLIPGRNSSQVDDLHRVTTLLCCKLRAL